MNKKILILAFLLISQLVHAQQKAIDSLTRLYQTATVDTLKIQYAYSLAGAMKDPATAWPYIDEGLRLAQQIHNPSYICYGQLVWSVLYVQQGNYPLSIKNAFACLKTAQETGNPNLVLMAYNNIASIYDDQEDEQKAIYYAQQSIAWAKRLNNKPKLVNAYYYLSYYYDKLGRPRQALACDQRANELAAQLNNDEVLKGQVYAGMGHTYLLLKQPEIGLPFLYKAFALVKMRNLPVVTDIYTFLANYYIAAGPRDSAIKYSAKQLDI
ncbi:MAG: tetratricopeptide repeat protein, partial [Bacteroidetes bacterium]|nr:tetratricopeptide repeat protein [Bacteroidota bacterium]